MPERDPVDAPQRLNTPLVAAGVPDTKEETMSDRINLAELREQAEQRGARRVSDGSLAHRPPEWGVVLALIDAVEAAHAAVILTYDPSRSDAQNDAYHRRAERLTLAHAKFDFGESA